MVYQCQLLFISGVVGHILHLTVPVQSPLASTVRSEDRVQDQDRIWPLNIKKAAFTICCLLLT